MKPSHTIRQVFDDPNLVSTAGLVPALRLAESAGLYELLETLTVPSPNAAVKTTSVLAGMVAGADSIDDLDLLRHGGTGRLFAGVRAPSTLGTFLRSFTHGHVQQLDKVNAALLAGLTDRLPALLAGDDETTTFVDVDAPPRALRAGRCPHDRPGPRLRYASSGVRVHRHPRAEPATGHAQHRDHGAGDRPRPAPARELRLPHRCGTTAGPGDRHRPRGPEPPVRSRRGPTPPTSATPLSAPPCGTKSDTRSPPA